MRHFKDWLVLKVFAQVCLLGLAAMPLDELERGDRVQDCKDGGQSVKFWQAVSKVLAGEK